MKTINLFLLCVASICFYGCSSKERFTITVNSFEEIDNYWDKDGAFKYEQDITDMSGFSEGYAIVTFYDSDDNKKYGYIDTTGKLAIPYEEYEEAHPFSEGLARIKKDNKYGYINTNGEIVIPCFFQWADDFSDGLARVGRKEEWMVDGFINTKGEMVIITNYERTKSFTDGLAAVKKDGGLWGYINTKGELAIPHQFKNAYEFSEGIAQVMYEYRRGSRKWEPDGYINTKGELLIKDMPTGIYGYADIEYFSNGFIREEVRGLIGYLNTKGETVIPHSYWQASIFTNGFAFVKTGINGKNGKNGFINTQGEMVCEVPSNIHLIELLQDGYCVIQDEHYNYGYMNIKGEILGGKCQYSCGGANSFSNGFATAALDYKRDGNNFRVWMILDKNGKHIIPLCRKR